MRHLQTKWTIFTTSMIAFIQNVKILTNIKIEKYLRPNNIETLNNLFILFDILIHGHISLLTDTYCAVSLCFPQIFEVTTFAYAVKIK